MSRFFDKLQYAIRVMYVKRNYDRVVSRLNRESHVRPLKVVFLVSELAKWKAQAIFDLMVADKLFSPEIAIMELTRNAKLQESELRRRAEEKIAYFRDRGMAVTDIWKYGTANTIDIDELGADVVFYQQPWDLPKNMLPWIVSRRALTFYFPYSTPNRWLVDLDLGHKLHHYLFGYIVINQELADLYERLKKNFVGAFVPNLLPFGHPTLDVIPFDDGSDDMTRCVIYAPHWSIQYGGLNPPLKYATFLENGKLILDFAKRHPEVKWAFKPHPDLADTLVRTGAMSRTEVEAYYREWELIGETCYSAEGDYLKLFVRSRALITDCGSFLTEYGCTGKPVIRLICRNLNVEPHPAVKNLYSCYYNVRNTEEILRAFQMIVLEGQDPNRVERRYELNKAQLVGHHVADRIVDYIRRCVSGDSIRE